MTESWRTRGTFLALLALKDGPKHGYEVASHLKEKSEGFFSLSFGALYPLLHKLETDGLIEGTWEDLGAKRRKVYALTSKGKKALQRERDQHQAYVEAFSKLLGGKA